MNCLHPTIIKISMSISLCCFMRLERTIGYGSVWNQTSFGHSKKEHFHIYGWYFIKPSYQLIVVSIQYKRLTGVDRCLYIFREVDVCGWLSVTKWLSSFHSHSIFKTSGFELLFCEKYRGRNVSLRILKIFFYESVNKESVSYVNNAR